MHICAHKKEDLCAHRFKSFSYTTPAYRHPCIPPPLHTPTPAYPDPCIPRPLHTPTPAYPHPCIPPPLHTPTPAYPRHFMTMLGPQKEGVNTNFLRAEVGRVWWVTVEDLTLSKEGCRISIQCVYLFRVSTDVVFLKCKTLPRKKCYKN